MTKCGEIKLQIQIVWLSIEPNINMRIVIIYNATLIHGFSISFLLWLMIKCIYTSRQVC
jgi:hypothetical protein